VTLPTAEALIAKISPAMPPPITRKSLPVELVVFMSSVGNITAIQFDAI
jgi:hypothetical protein